MSGHRRDVPPSFATGLYTVASWDSVFQSFAYKQLANFIVERHHQVWVGPVRQPPEVRIVAPRRGVA